MAYRIRRWTWLVLVMVALGISLLLSRGSSLPLQAQTNATPPALAPALPMVSGSFEDAQGRFKVGILEGFEVSSGGGAPIFQAADGSLAYTVVVAPTAPNASNPDLVRVATDVFGQGEGFTTNGVQALPGGGLSIDWTGQLSQGAAPPQPMVGKILAKQRDTSVFLLMVAATDAAAEQAGDAITTLGSTLKVP